MKNMKKYWLKLDNAAKIFPSIISRKDTKVFRVSFALKEPIQEKYIQEALEETLNIFPHYQFVLKKGIFWYYLEATTMIPKIEKEHLPICAPIYNKHKKKLLFRVFFYETRISLEVFHVLSDGTGAIQFMKTMTIAYLAKIQPRKFAKIPITLDYDASFQDKIEDSFDKYYRKRLKNPERIKHKRKVYHIKGYHFSENRLKIIEGVTSTSALLGYAHTYHTTLTSLVSSILILSIYQQMSLRERSQEIVLTIPVNLRKYFPSVTARNFFGTIPLTYHFQTENPTLEEIIPTITEQLKQALQPEKLALQMNQFVKLEHHPLIRFVPRILKNVILRAANYQSSRNHTMTLSNIGKTDMPKEITDEIDCVSVVASTGSMQLCICSYRDQITFGFTTHLQNTTIPMHFFRMLTSLSLTVTIKSNHLKEES